MSRKILEDVKINKKKILVVSKAEPKEPPIRTSTPNLSKYDFLKKKSTSSTLTDTTISKTPSSSQRIPTTPKLPSKGRPFSKMILFFFVVSIIVGIFYLLSTVFLRVNVTITPKNQSFDLKHQKFTASKGGGVPFELMVVSDTESKDVVLTSSSSVSEKAKGEVTFFNEYSSKPEKVVAGSFLSDEKGKSYKVDKTISIPGYTLNKTKIVPGQISVGITSFLSGEAYNGEPNYFYLNTLKGTAKYKKVYAKTKTPLTGGTTGLVYSLDEKEKANILSNVSSLKERLLRKLNAQVPEGYLLYSNAVDFNYNLGENITSKTPDTKIEITGTLGAFLIKEKDLSSVVINKLLPDISAKEKSEIVSPKLSPLSFNFVNKEQIIDKSIENFDFELTGSLPIKWSPNIDELKVLLIGKDKKEVAPIFKQDPGILSAQVKIIPFWVKKLPHVLKNINIYTK